MLSLQLSELSGELYQWPALVVFCVQEGYRQLGSGVAAFVLPLSGHLNVDELDCLIGGSAVPFFLLYILGDRVGSILFDRNSSANQ